MKRLLILASLTLTLALATGCSYKGGKVVDGTNLEIGICVPGTDLTINALSYTSGIKIGGNSNTTIVVSHSVAETNSYFGVVQMRRVTSTEASISPAKAD